MGNAAEQIQDDIEQHGLDDLIDNLDSEEQAEQEQKANQEKAEQEQAKNAQIEKARILAERLNGGFLWCVDKAICPDIQIDDIADREAGNTALLPVAIALGGDMPPWMVLLFAKYGPYIKAGLYMGATIYAAKTAQADYEQKEREKQAEKAKQAQWQPRKEGDNFTDQGAANNGD